jgi:hypothetical protein
MLPGLPFSIAWRRQKIRNRPSLSCLEALLQGGADPYEKYEGLSVWNHAINKFSEIIQDPESLEGFDASRHPINEWIDVLEIFIKYGASISSLYSKIAHLVKTFAKHYGHSYMNDELGRLNKILNIYIQNENETGFEKVELT